jgi:FOG: WD40-like repeat
VLFCGTLLDVAATGQASVFALNAITTNAIRRVIWSHNAGSISNRPMLNDNASFGQRLYVANQAGSMNAYNPEGNGIGGPNIYWSANVTAGSPINRSPWIEARAGTFKDKILILDTAGVLRAYQDDGTSAGGPLWVSSSTGTATWVSLPIVLPGVTTSYAYVGRNDGFLQQVNLATGSPEGRQQVNITNAFPGDFVFDPSLDIQASNVGNVNRAYVVDDGGFTNHALKRFKLPFCTDSGDAAAAFACVTNPDGTNDCNSWTPNQATGAGGANLAPDETVDDGTQRTNLPRSQ